jgi:hypothetical protein
LIDLNQLKKLSKTKINNKLNFSSKIKKFSFSLKKKLNHFKVKSYEIPLNFNLEIFPSCSANYAVGKKDSTP